MGVTVVIDIPAARGRVETTRKARRTQNGNVSPQYRTVVDKCPRCTETHSFLGRLDGAVAFPACGIVRVVAE